MVGNLTPQLATESLMERFSEIRWKTVATGIVSPEGRARYLTVSQ